MDIHSQNDLTARLADALVEPGTYDARWVVYDPRPPQFRRVFGQKLPRPIIAYSIDDEYFVPTFNRFLLFERAQELDDVFALVPTWDQNRDKGLAPGPVGRPNLTCVEFLR